jgi:organic hydroperoxide reductase OsmC/OhrA
MSVNANTAPTVRHRTFTYRTSVEWLGSRAGGLGAEGKPGFRVSSPPEFKGENGVWTPEDLFVAAVNVCTMTTFASFAQRLGLPVVSYRSDSEGRLEFVDGGYRFTLVTLRPTVLVGTAEAVAPVEKALADAHRNCLISNSIRAVVALEPQVVVS